VSAAISKAMYICHLPASDVTSFCEMASVMLELQPAKSVGSSVRIVCGVGARPASIQCGVECESLLERGGGVLALQRY
jgi:hypothetical protein